MTKIVVVSGNPRAGSRTLGLATAVGSAIGSAAGSAAGSAVDLAAVDEPGVVDVGALGAGLLVPGDPATAAAVQALKDADLLIVATPTYKGSYTGILKVLLDQLPANALAGKRAVPVAIAGVAPQAIAAEALLRQLLIELGAEVIEPGLPVVEADLSESATVAEKYAAAHDW
jgi:FMN reductase